jgi:hypothetical protein
VGPHAEGLIITAPCPHPTLSRIAGEGTEREDLAGPRTIGHVTIGGMLGYLDFRFPSDGWRQRRRTLAASYREVEQLPSMQAA